MNWMYDSSGPMIPSTLLADTERFLHEQIPLSKAMGVTLESYDETQIVLSAPLEPNHNHLGTAFGGSLAAIATLSGYSLLWLLLGNPQAHIVVRSSSISYQRPVTGRIRAICEAPDSSLIQSFHAHFRKAGKARIPLRVTIEEEGLPCVIFDGVFVAIQS